MHKDKKIPIHSESVIVTLTLISTIFFGIIDGALFIFVADTVQKKFASIEGFDENMAELATGGISTATAIFLSSFIHEKIHEHRGHRAQSKCNGHAREKYQACRCPKE